MGQSLVKNYIHIVFSTKNRTPWIKPPLDAELYVYIGGICKNLESYPIQVGGYQDHVHILCSLSKKIALMKLVEVIKSNSSKWLKSTDKALESFYWQNGYGAFSIGQNKVETVAQYILNQNAHHQKRTFEKEYLTLLENHGVQYDEKYLWE